MANEVVEIVRAAEKFGIPIPALCALRVAENGGPGREFGVLSIPAPTYRDQVQIAANSFRNSEARYKAAHDKEARGEDGHYTDDFLRFFSARWAPVGATNDPTNLNAHHAENLIRTYRQFQGGRPA